MNLNVLSTGPFTDSSNNILNVIPIIQTDINNNTLYQTDNLGN